MNITTHIKDFSHSPKEEMVRSLIQALIVMFVLIVVAIMFMTGCSTTETHVVETVETRVIRTPKPRVILIPTTRVYVPKTYRPKYYISKKKKGKTHTRRYRKIRVYPNSPLWKP